MTERATRNLLSERLAGVVPSTFFRPLARPSAPVYIDCADRLAESADEGGQVAHSDTVALIREVLAAHPQIQLAEDEGAAMTDLRQRAVQLYNKLLEAGWLQERHVSLDERWVLLTPYMRRLLRTLRELATDEVSDLKDFAATLRSICKSLLAEGALDPSRLNAEEYRQTVKELVDRVERATDQMHAVETLILRHEQQQRVSGSASETLNRFLVEFHAGEHMVCYDALQQGGLMPRLLQARAVVQEAMANPFAKQRLAEGLMAHRKLAQTEAYAEAERLLNDLERGLAAIPAKQRIIDGRMADFSRLSEQRYRYQTEIRGRQADQVKEFMLAANARHAGNPFAALASEPGLPFLSVRVALRFGIDSLYRPRRVRSSVNLTVAELLSHSDSLGAQELIRQRNLYSVTPQRAGRFVETRLPEKGDTISTSELKLIREDDLLDLLAVLAFERAASSTSHKPVRWCVHTERNLHGLEPEKIPTDPLSGRRIERLMIQRIA